MSTTFFFLFFALMLYEAARLFWPYIGSIGSAIVLAVVFRPWYNAIGRRFSRLAPTWRAMLMDMIVIILFVIPVAFLIWSAVAEAQTLYPVLAEKLSHASGLIHQNPVDRFPWLRRLPRSAQEALNVRSTQFKTHVDEAAQRIFTFLAGVGTIAARRLLDVVLDLILMVFCLFFMFRDGEAMYAQLQALVPLSRRSKVRLNQTMQRTIVGVVRGTFLMSLAQTFVMAVGLLIVRAEAIVLLCFLTFAATFIPTVGTALIWAPAAIYFFLAGARWKGIFLLLWGMLGIGTLDNVLRPYLAGAGEEMSFFWLVFAIVGGLEAFGIKGLLLGPLILSLMPVIFDIYKNRYLDIPED